MLVQPFKQLIKTSIVVLTCLVCTSCWSSTTIEDQIYISAIGVDYVDDEYVVYGQVQSFQSIVELKQQSDGSASGTFVGVSKGASVFEAATNLAKTSQYKIEWGHIEAVVVSERALDKDGIEIPRRIYRVPETRYNTWFYVTSSSILDLFTKGNIYDVTSLSTILFNPKTVYRQNTTVKPLLTFDFVAKINEPDRTVAIPKLKINEDQWKNGQSNIELLEIDAAHFISKYGKAHTFMLDDIPGFKLLQYPSRNRVDVSDEEGNIVAVFVVEPHKKSYKVNIVAGEPKFTIKMRYVGTTYELKDDMGYDEMMNKLKKKIEDDIRQTYLEGIKNEVDVYNLMPKLRHKNQVLWQELTDGGLQFILNEESLDQIILDVRIPFNGKYKRIAENNQR